MSTRDIYVPQSMLDLLQFHRRRKEFILATVLAYSIIDAWSIRNKPDKYGKKWRSILRTHFDGISGKRNTVSNAIEWLEVNGFIEIKKRISKTGNIINDNKKEKYPNRYRIKSKKKWTTFAVDEDRYYRANAVTITGDDWASNSTRSNLGLLSRCEGIEVKEKNNRASRATWTIENNAGIVRKGKNVQRLFSPWCFASEEVRGLFLFDGEPWVSFDLGSAQPTIIGKLADDLDLRKACMNDQLYPAIAELLGLDPIIDRTKAKGAFYVWCYGPKIEEQPTLERLGRSSHFKKLKFEEQTKTFLTKLQTWEVQKYMAHKYPTTEIYAAKSKCPDYRKFARKMQDLEASIFLDKIFAELVQLGIPTLTCHDGIYSPERYAQQVEKICRKHLFSFFGSLFVLKSSSN